MLKELHDVSATSTDKSMYVIFLIAETECKNIITGNAHCTKTRMTPEVAKKHFAKIVHLLQKYNPQSAIIDEPKDKKD